MVKPHLLDLVKKTGILIVPGVYDALTARIAEKTGFEAIIMGGLSVSAARLGKPDLGYVTMPEMASQVKIIADATNIPLITDGDTGYGSPLNVMRTVQEYERAGASGIILEDQQWPKKCGHMDGKQVISMKEHVKKIEAASEARSNKNFVIIGRTDALSTHGLDEAIRRGKAYREAGADVIFVEAPQSVEQLATTRDAIKQTPLIANMAEGGKTPPLSAEELKRISYEIVFFGCTSIFIIAKALMEAMKYLYRNGNTNGLLDRMLTLPQFNEFLDIQDFSSLEKRFVI
jgi:2-methylisocitrate lyase-like PEP mutase family enzyme